MEEVLYYSALYDCYKALFTEKQQSYFEGYYFYNLSFGELAENEGVSRNAIFKQVKEVCKKLEEYEEKLHLLKQRKELEALLKEDRIDLLKEHLTKLLEK